MKRLWGIILTVALFLQPIVGGEIDEYVSHPGNIPDFYDFKKSFIQMISNRIVNSIRGINRVVYDVTSKPPSTIELE